MERCLGHKTDSFDGLDMAGGEGGSVKDSDQVAEVRDPSGTSTLHPPTRALHGERLVQGPTSAPQASASPPGCLRCGRGSPTPHCVTPGQFLGLSGPVPGASMHPPLQEEHEGAGSHQLRQRTLKNLSCQPHPPLPGTQQAEGHLGQGLRKRTWPSPSCPALTTSPLPRRGPLESKPPIPGAVSPDPASDSEPHSVAGAAQALGMNSLP